VNKFKKIVADKVSQNGVRFALYARANGKFTVYKLKENYCRRRHFTSWTFESVKTQLTLVEATNMFDKLTHK
jgi:hypothetical protein